MCSHSDKIEYLLGELVLQAESVGVTCRPLEPDWEELTPALSTG
jgi:hypothetical protein